MCWTENFVSQDSTYFSSYSVFRNPYWKKTDEEKWKAANERGGEKDKTDEGKKEKDEGRRKRLRRKRKKTG
jgi:hypothetical protein